MILCGPTADAAAARDARPVVAESAQPQAPGPPALVEVGRDRHDRMTVPVTIAGAGPFRFMIDTGAQATVLTHGLAASLGLAPDGRATIVGMASRSTVETVTVRDLNFAGRRIAALTAPLLQGSHVGADGILGLDALQDLRIVIDFKGKALSVTDSPAGGSADFDIVVRARRKLGQMIITDARVDGIRTAVIIDTGSWDTHGNLALRRRLRARAFETTVTTDVAGAALVGGAALVSRVTMGAAGLADVPVTFADSPAFAALGFGDKPALILGLGNLRPFERVAIDFARRRILFDVPGPGGRDPFGATAELSRVPG